MKFAPQVTLFPPNSSRYRDISLYPISAARAAEMLASKRACVRVKRKKIVYSIELSAREDTDDSTEPTHSHGVPSGTLYTRQEELPSGRTILQHKLLPDPEKMGMDSRLAVDLKAFYEGIFRRVQLDCHIVG